MQDLSLYYGLAIQRHLDSVEGKEIWATYYHKISTDEKPQHLLCPNGDKTHGVSGISIKPRELYFLIHLLSTKKLNRF